MVVEACVFGTVIHLIGKKVDELFLFLEVDILLLQ